MVSLLSCCCPIDWDSYRLPLLFGKQEEECNSVFLFPRPFELKERDKTLKESILAVASDTKRKVSVPKKCDVVIENFIYLGNCEAFKEWSEYADIYVEKRSIISAYRVEFVQNDNIEHLFLDIDYGDDSVNIWACTGGIKENLYKIFALIDKARIEKTPLLIHCVAGSSRSPILLIAYLMMACHVSSIDATKYVKSKRNIYPNENIMKKLTEEFDDLPQNFD